MDRGAGVVAGAEPVLAIAGSFSIDSVVAPDGRALPAKTGGNAVWSALGALIGGGRSTRVLARLGEDYPQEIVDRLSAAGLDLSAVRRVPGPHPVRVTFAHLADGRRLQPVPERLLAAMPPEVRAQFVDTTSSPEVLAGGAPRGEDVPVAWLREVDAWHLPLLPLAPHRSVVAALAARRGVLHADCPARTELVADPFGRLAETLGSIDVFLPSTSDFDVFAPYDEPTSTVDGIVAAGAGTVVLKAGADGVLVFDEGAVWHVPAYDVPVLDPTGAGDVFCGGFLLGRASGADLVAAAALGSAAASFAIGTADPLHLLAVEPERTRERARDLVRAARRLDDADLLLTRATHGGVR
jgi:sugar/nucleoside kinase (ribokinase family)